MAGRNGRRLILAAFAALSFLSSVAASFAQAPGPVPALPDTERRTSYVISGTTCACAVNFQLYGDSTDVANWLKVYINGVEIPQSGNWNITSPSGSIGTLARPITDGVLTFTAARTGTVQIVGAQRPRRLSEFSENRGVAARDLNQVLNGIEAQLREMWDRQFRTVQAPPGDTLALLPLLANRTSMGACFDSGGNLNSCVSVPSSTFAAGNGISLTGTGPTTIAANLAAVPPIVLSGTNPISFSCPTCITAAGVTSIAGNTGAFTLGGGITNTVNQIRLANNGATLSGSPGNPSGAGSASPLMMGLGSTCTITPVFSTRVRVSFTGVVFNNTNGNVSTLGARYGTGVAPANGAASTGTSMMNTYAVNHPTANIGVPFPAGGVLTGLTAGTAYWLDLTLAANANTSNVNGISCQAHEF